MKPKIFLRQHRAAFFLSYGEGTVAKGSACFRTFWLPYSRGAGLSFLSHAHSAKNVPFAILHYFLSCPANRTCRVKLKGCLFHRETSCSCGKCDASVKAVSV